MVLIFGFVLFLALNSSGLLTTESQFAQENLIIWNYFIQKYSSQQPTPPDPSFLNPHNIQRQFCEILPKFEANSTSISSSSYKSESVGCFENPLNEYLTNVTNFGEFEKICPRLLYSIDNGECCESSPILNSKKNQKSHSKKDKKIELNSSESDESKNKKPSSTEVWGYGFLFVTLISSCSLAGVCVLPFMGKDIYTKVLTVMVGLAVGSLTGSALFHLIPQAFGLLENESDPNHGYLNISLVVCGGIWMFFMIERILKFIMDYKERKEKKNFGVDDSFEKVLTTSNSNNSTTIVSSLVDDLNNGVNDRNSITTIPTTTTTEMIFESQKQAIKSSFGNPNRPSNCHEHQAIKFEQGKDSVIATVAWMIIFGDGLHNFIDGLSIGTAFNQSILTGVSISIAVVCEELPHELGDFAVLLNAGMTMKQALFYNFLSACTCYFGMAVGILLGEIEAGVYIFAIAGGMFLYIALVDMVPEMNEVAQEKSKLSVKEGLKVLVLQNVGLFLGVFSLFILAKYQGNIQF